MRTLLVAVSWLVATCLTACQIESRTYTSDDTPIDADPIDMPDAETQAILVDDADETSVIVEEGGTETVAVTLRIPPDGSIAVTVTADDDAQASATPAALTFDETNYDTPQLVTISGTQDADNTGEQTSVTLTAPGATGATIDVTVNDDENQAVLVATGDVTIVEGGSTQVGVTLRFPPPSPVTVAVTSSTDAVATVSPAELTFSDVTWDQPQNVTIVAADDDNVVTDTASISLTLDGANTGIIDVTVTDQDTLAFVVSAATLTVPENDTGSFTVRLSHQPSETVAVAVAPMTSGIYTVSPDSMTFNSVNWSTPQTVTVMPVGDGDNVDESTAARITATGLATASVNVSIDDTTQILTFGWPTYFGQFRDYGSGILHAFKFTVTGTTPVTIDRWGVISSAPGSTMARMAIYTNGVSGPGNLLASSGSFPLSTGQYDVPDTVTLDPGTYWLAYQGSATVNIGYSMNATTADSYCNEDIPFTDPLPQTWVSQLCIPFEFMNIYIVTWR